MSAALAFVDDELQMPRRRHLHLVAVDRGIDDRAVSNGALSEERYIIETCGARSATKPFTL